jgi:thioesterase domain-containing protein
MTYTQNGQTDSNRVAAIFADVLGLASVDVATPDMRADLRTRMLAFETNYRAALSYRPGRYDGPMVLITAGENEATRDTGGWAALAPALDHRTAGGDHYSMLRAPHLAGLAATLRDALAGHDPAVGPDSGDTTGPQTRP